MFGTAELREIAADAECAVIISTPKLLGQLDLATTTEHADGTVVVYDIRANGIVDTYRAATSEAVAVPRSTAEPPA